MLSIGELSLFLTEDLYLVPGEDLNPTLNALKAESTLEETEEEKAEPFFEEQSHSKEKIVFNPVLFITDKPFTGISLETFKNLVNKGLNLSENDFTLINQEEVFFTKPSDVNSTKLILFGTSFTGFSQKYKVHSLQNQLILLADAMERIAENIELKKQLWVQLQLMFPK